MANDPRSVKVTVDFRRPNGTVTGISFEEIRPLWDVLSALFGPDAFLVFNFGIITIHHIDLAKFNERFGGE